MSAREIAQQIVRESEARMEDLTMDDDADAAILEDAITRALTTAWTAGRDAAETQTLLVACAQCGPGAMHVHCAQLLDTVAAAIHALPPPESAP